MVIFLIAFSAILLFALIGALEQVHHLRIQLHLLRKTGKMITGKGFQDDQY